MTVNRRIKTFLLSLLVADVGASLWLLILSPTDTEAYSGFLPYEAWRAFCWIPLALSGCLLLKWMYVRVSGDSDAALAFALTSAIGVSIETLTSFCHWKSPHSRGVRALYESAWYWHRVPRPGDYGWPSFKGYLLDHFIPWAILFLAGLIISYTWRRLK